MRCEACHFDDRLRTDKSFIQIYKRDTERPGVFYYLKFIDLINAQEIEVDVYSCPICKTLRIEEKTGRIEE